MDDSIDMVDNSIVDLYRKLSIHNYKLLYFKQASDHIQICNTIKKDLAHNSANISLNLVS